MASTWTCKVSYDGGVYTPNSGGNPNPLAYGVVFEFSCICQPLLDPLPQFNNAVDFGHYSVRFGVANDGRSFLGISVQAGANEINTDYWTLMGDLRFYSDVAVIYTVDSSAFLGGGTISITKDYDGDLISATGPMGTVSVPLSHMDIYLAGIGSPSYRNTFPMVPQGIGGGFTLADPTFSFPVYAQINEAKFYNIIAQENGVTYKTIALSAADPGRFYTPDWGNAFDPLDGITNLLTAPFWVLAQETSRLHATMQVTLANFPQDPASLPYRIFDFQHRLRSPVGGAISLTRAPEHGSIYGALVYVADPGTVRLRKTYDSGRTWAETNLFSDAGTTNDTAVIAWSGGKLYALWRQNTALVQSVSSDLGATWGVPVALAITGTNPFLLVDPRHGLQYYLYLDGSFNLQLVRSDNFGHTFIDASPHLVAATIGEQTIAAEFASDGSLLVGYIVSAAWTQLRSKDLGLTWS